MVSELLIGDIPSFKLFESEKVLAFLDIQPLSRGHAVRSIAYLCTMLPKMTDKISSSYLSSTARS